MTHEASIMSGIMLIMISPWMVAPLKPKRPVCRCRLKPNGSVRHLLLTTCPFELMKENYVFLACT